MLLFVEVIPLLMKLFSFFSLDPHEKNNASQLLDSFPIAAGIYQSLSHYVCNVLSLSAHNRKAGAKTHPLVGRSIEAPACRGGCYVPFQAEDYLYSSANDYAGVKGYIDIVFLE